MDDKWHLWGQSRRPTARRRSFIQEVQKLAQLLTRRLLQPERQVVVVKRRIRARSCAKIPREHRQQPPSSLVHRRDGRGFGLRQHTAVELDPFRIIDVSHPTDRSKRLKLELGIRSEERRVGKECKSPW